jgi:2-polyprenyl-3-methyl-5-hydroxy-6-metoxy-1,4-benzoquinol methylase
VFHVEPSSMKQDSVCPICNREKFNPLFVVTDYSVSKKAFTLETCTSCGLIRTHPRPNSKDLPRYYASEEYVSHNDSKKGMINRIYQTAKWFTLRQKERWISNFKVSGLLLDYGCGTGDFIHHMQKKNWEVRGLEPDPGARKLANEKVPNLVHDLPHINSFIADSFDVITLWHVLEHMEDLNAPFNAFSGLLKQSGILVIAVPNPLSHDASHYTSHWAAWDVPRHLYHFTSSTLIQLASNYKFQHVRTFPMKLDAYYVSMLSEKYKKGSVFKAIINGFKSNLFASKTGNYSSLSYIFRKIPS